MVMPKNPTRTLPNSLAWTAGYPKAVPTTDPNGVPVGDPTPPSPPPPPDEFPPPPEPAPEPTDPYNP